MAATETFPMFDHWKPEDDRENIEERSVAGIFRFLSYDPRPEPLRSREPPCNWPSFRWSARVLGVSG